MTLLIFSFPQQLGLAQQSHSEPCPLKEGERVVLQFGLPWSEAPGQVMISELSWT